MLRECIYGECAHEQHVRRTLTLTLTHTITAYSVSGNVVSVRVLICATRQKPCRKRVYRYCSVSASSEWQWHCNSIGRERQTDDGMLWTWEKPRAAVTDSTNSVIMSVGSSCLLRAFSLSYQLDNNSLASHRRPHSETAIYRRVGHQLVS